MLSREQLEDAKTCPQHGCVKCKMNPLETDFCQTKLAEEALELLDKTEAQEKEIKQLKKQLTYEEGTMESEAFDARQLRYDINQLKKQNAAMIEALDIARPLAEYEINNCPNFEPCKKCEGNNDCSSYKIVTACKVALDVIGGGK